MNAKPKIAVQLFSVHKYTDSVGLERTLADVAKIGYKGVEFAGWTVFAGHDPCAQFTKYPGRSPTLHAKENGTDEPGFDAILGRPAAGKPGVDWAGLIPVAEKDGVEWFVVECERHFDSLEAITPSFDFLSKAMSER